MRDILAKIGNTPAILRGLRRVLADNNGVAAVEFALIAPLLVLLFLGTVETSYAVSVDRKISRTASAIADLITQTDKSTLPEAELRQLMDIADNIMAPYSTIPCIVVTGISISGGDAKVAWSYDNSQVANANGTVCSVKPDATQLARVARSKNSLYPVPSAIKIDGTFLVAAEIEADHKPIVGFFTYSKDSGLSQDSTAITLSDQILLRPRIGSEIDVK